MVHSVADASERAPASERPATADVAGERHDRSPATSRATTTATVVAARIVARAKPWAWSTAPARPSSSPIAIGIVGVPLRDRKLVAPNPPGEIAAASPAAAATGRRRWGIVTA